MVSPFVEFKREDGSIVRVHVDCISAISAGVEGGYSMIHADGTWHDVPFTPDDAERMVLDKWQELDEDARHEELFGN